MFVVIVNTIQDMAAIQPVLFLSHGAGPSFYLDAKTMPRFKGMDKDSAAAEFLRNVNKTVGLKKPEAILVLSAHWEESVWTVNTNSKHSLYFDYYNFPPETYELKWPAKGAPEVARKVKTLLEDRGIKCSENSKRGLDHGVFVPLKLAYPDADVPVCQLSLLKNLSVKEHLEIAEALSDLSREGILIVGSGFATHNGGKNGAQPPAWATAFKTWLNDTLTNEKYTPEDRKMKLLSCETSAPEIETAHPTIEHFLPLIMCSAVAKYRPGKLLHSEFIMGSLLNEHYLFPSS